MKDVKISSNKQFGLLFFLVFLIIAFYPTFNEGNLRVWAVIISFIFLILGLRNSKLLFPFNKAWIKFGIILGQIVSPVIMGTVFFLIVTPISFLMRVFRKDLLNLKFNKDQSYWVEKKEPKSKMKNQF